MPQRKQGKVEPQKSIEVHAADIFVARSKSAEPYIKSFIAAPENVTQESLGTIVGVFSVSDRSESSAYVVNTLASVAKKEYFANPRRGALESFESTLHRMNVALAELVKHGQTAWIGNLHGAVAVVEKYTLHFSVTGEGAIFLFRGGILSDIGDGLASEEARSHPIKTFVEISSGRLAALDYVLLASPELFTLFDRSELERSARRIGTGRKFSQFLETAMVNELRSGAAVALDVSEKIVEAVPETEPQRRPSRKPPVINAWSARTFQEKQVEKTTYFDDVPEPGPVRPADMRTTGNDDARHGEIYVRGESSGDHDEHPTVTRCRWILEDTLSRYEAAKVRAKERLRQRSESIAVSVSGAIASSLGKIRRPKLPRPDISSVVQTATEPERDAAPTPTDAGRAGAAVPEQSRHRLPVFPKFGLPKVSVPPLPNIDVKRRIARLKRWAGRLGGYVVRTAGSLYAGIIVPGSRSVGSATLRAGSFLKRRLLALSPKHRLIVASGATFALTLGAVLVWNVLTGKTPEPVPVVITEAPAPAFPPSGEKNAVLASPETVPGTPDDMIAPVFMNDRLYLVGERTVVDAESGAAYPSPAESPVRYAAGMDDLNLIFLSMENGDLYSFAPANRSFTRNLIPLPSGFRTAGIGSFLTYLYFLEEGTGNVHRYPRAEGGFGEGLRWTKDPFPDGTRTMAVSEAIYGAADTSLSAFLRGRPSEGFSPEYPATALSVTALCANPDAPGILAVVDAPAKRVVAFADSGAIVRQYFSESFSDATACSLKGDGSSVAVSAGQETLLLPLTDDRQ